MSARVMGRLFAVAFLALSLVMLLFWSAFAYEAYQDLQQMRERTELMQFEQQTDQAVRDALKAKQAAALLNQSGQSKEKQ